MIHECSPSDAGQVSPDHAMQQHLPTAPSVVATTTRNRTRIFRPVDDVSDVVLVVHTKSARFNRVNRVYLHQMGCAEYWSEVVGLVHDKRGWSSIRCAVTASDVRTTRRVPSATISWSVQSILQRRQTHSHCCGAASPEPEAALKAKRSVSRHTPQLIRREHSAPNSPSETAATPEFLLIG